MRRYMTNARAVCLEASARHIKLGDEKHMFIYLIWGGEPEDDSTITRCTITASSRSGRIVRDDVGSLARKACVLNSAVLCAR